jgi:hypothetical protein
MEVHNKHFRQKCRKTRGLIEVRKTRQVGISFPLDLLEELDRRRGLVSRSRYVVDIVEKSLMHD